MDYIKAIQILRPDATWKNNHVNPYNLETIAESYQSKDKLPTKEECKQALEDVKAGDDWESVMQQSDTTDMPRWLEDHIEFDHNGDISGESLQDRYDRKKLKRSKKPN